MCCSDYSTTYGYLIGNQIKKSYDLDNITVDLSKLKIISLYGGEPLQSPNLKKLCAKISTAKPQIVNIVTSCAKPKKGNLDALKSLNAKINFRISIDAPQDLNQWIRGYNIDDWLETFQELKSIGSINWQITIGNYNIFALPECLDYLESIMPDKDILPNMVFHPSECAVSQLPNYLKSIIREKLLNYKSQFNNQNVISTALELLDKDQTIEWNKCKEFINYIPNLRRSTNTIDYWLEKYLTNIK
jgi:hypothetical protein